MQYIIINGEIISDTEAEITHFMWSEPFVITHKIWFGHAGIPLFKENLKQLKQLFTSYNVKMPALFNNERELYRRLKRMLNKNRYYRTGLLSFRFLIDANAVNYLVTPTIFTRFDFAISSTGVLVEYANKQQTLSPELSAFAHFHRPTWKVAYNNITEENANEVILLNSEGHICESPEANIFLIKDGIMVTPSLKTGCYNDVLRPFILQAAQKLGMKCLEPDNIEPKHFLSMDEAFLASETRGIQCILGIGKSRFVRDNAVQIHAQLNQFLKKRAEFLVEGK